MSLQRWVFYIDHLLFAYTVMYTLITVHGFRILRASTVSKSARSFSVPTSRVATTCFVIRIRLTFRVIVLGALVGSP
jgi:uncharacterized membrane protein